MGVCSGRLEECRATTLQDWLSGDCPFCQPSNPYEGRMMTDAERDSMRDAYREVFGTTEESG